MPDVELGVNDLERMGLEVVGRHDILPCPTEQWIRYENIEFHHIIDKKAFAKEDHIIKFRPPDAGYLELMRFRVRPPKCRELPMQARCMFQITGNKVRAGRLQQSCLLTLSHVCCLSCRSRSART
jgi:hypothetical protein